MFFQRFGGIMRAGWNKAALRAKPWGDDPLIDLYQQDKREAEYAENRFYVFIFYYYVWLC
jgi:hypothetical protein